MERSRQQAGKPVAPATLRNGRRCSAATPIYGRRFVTLLVHALTTRIVIENNRAIGVTYAASGAGITAFANRQVLLCGGAINSPQLLNLSSIGDPDEVRSQGIEVCVPLKGVGKNLQDHIWAGVSYLRRSPGSLHRSMRLDRISRELSNAYFRGIGIATDLPSGSMAFLKSAPDVSLPDVQLIPIAAPITAPPYLKPFCAPYEDGFVIRAAVLRPESRRYVRIKSIDPDSAPIIVQNFLATGKDREVLRAGVRIACNVGRQGPLKRFIAKELAPT